MKMKRPMCGVCLAAGYEGRLCGDCDRVPPMPELPGKLQEIIDLCHVGETTSVAKVANALQVSRTQARPWLDKLAEIGLMDRWMARHEGRKPHYLYSRRR